MTTMLNALKSLITRLRKRIRIILLTISQGLTEKPNPHNRNLQIQERVYESSLPSVRIWVSLVQQ